MIATHAHDVADLIARHVDLNERAVDLASYGFTA
jgi:hypothetical protein